MVPVFNPLPGSYSSERHDSIGIHWDAVHRAHRGIIHDNDHRTCVQGRNVGLRAAKRSVYAPSRDAGLSTEAILSTLTTVAIDSETPEATICCTTDGSWPRSDNETPHSGPYEVEVSFFWQDTGGLIDTKTVTVTP